MLEDLVSVLRRPRFVVVVGGEGISMVGDAAFAIALAWLVIQRTGSVTTLAGVLLLQAAPRSLLLLLGGAVVDRYSPRLVMLACHVVRALAMATLAAAAVVSDPPLWQFYCLALVMGVASAFFLPAGRRSSPPSSTRTTWIGPTPSRACSSSPPSSSAQCSVGSLSRARVPRRRSG